MGRPRKPEHIHMINGNPSRRKIPKEPSFPPLKSLEPPDYLNRVARKEWRRLAPKLVEDGLLTEMDRTAFAAYCVHFSLWRQALEELSSDGDLTCLVDGIPKANVLERIARQHGVLCNSFGKEFGLSPATRSKVSITTVGEGDDDKDMFGDK